MALNRRLQRCGVLMFGLMIGAMATDAHAAPGAPGDVEKTFAAPCDYPMGLATDGAKLYVADWRDAKVYAIDPADGSSTPIMTAPTLNPSGMTWGDGRLWISDDHTGRIHGINLDTGVAEIVFPAPEKKATGLAWDDGVLFVLAKDKIYRVTPDDGTILGYYTLPSKGSRHLAHDGMYLWVSNRTADELYMMQPETGKVIAILNAPGPHAAGVVWRNDVLWNVDFQTRKLYAITVDGDQHYSLSDPRRSRVEYLWTLSNYGPGEVRDVKVGFAIPQELKHQKLLAGVKFDPAPARTELDSWGQPCAVYEFESLPAGEKLAITWTAEVELSQINWVIRPELVGSLDDIPTHIRDQYTADASRFQITDPYIANLVKRIVGDEENPYWKARKIYDHIIDEIEYLMIGGWDVPKVVLQRGSGSCSEYTYTFIAMCRAAGIPARYQGSVSMRGDDASIDEAFHRWAEIYLPGYGWVPVDANRGDKKSPADQCRGFGNLKNSLLITTHGGGGSEFLAWGYNAHETYQMKGYCNVQQESFGFWAPLDGDHEDPTTEKKSMPLSGCTAELPF